MPFLLMKTKKMLNFKGLAEIFAKTVFMQFTNFVFSLNVKPIRLSLTVLLYLILLFSGNLPGMFQNLWYCEQN